MIFHHTQKFPQSIEKCSPFTILSLILNELQKKLATAICIDNSSHCAIFSSTIQKVNDIIKNELNKIK